MFLQKFLGRAKLYLFLHQPGHSETMVSIQAGSRPVLIISVRLDIGRMKPVPTWYEKNKLGPSYPDPSKSSKARAQLSPESVMTGLFRPEKTEDQVRSVNKKMPEVVRADLLLQSFTTWVFLRVKQVCFSGHFYFKNEKKIILQQIWCLSYLLHGRRQNRNICRKVSPAFLCLQYIHLPPSFFKQSLTASFSLRSIISAQKSFDFEGLVITEVK